MSFLTTKHCANVIVRVTPDQWLHCPLAAIHDWLFENDGYFARTRTLDNPESDGLAYEVKSQFRTRLVAAEASLRNGRQPMFDVFRLCRLMIVDLPSSGQTDHYLEIRVRDFSLDPHYKHARNFVNTTCQRQPGICGFDYTSISFEQPLDCASISNERPDEFWIQPQRLLRTLGTFFENIMATGSWQDPLWQIIDGVPLQWQGPHGIDVAVSLVNVTGVLARIRVREEAYLRWQVVANGVAQPSLRFTLTPAIGYEQWRNSNPEDGKSLYGFAKTLKGLLDIGR